MLANVHQVIMEYGEGPLYMHSQPFTSLESTGEQDAGCRLSGRCVYAVASLPAGGTQLIPRGPRWKKFPPIPVDVALVASLPFPFLL